MNYFVKPRGRRLSEYEILCCYTQPTPDWIPGGLDWGDWTQKFHGGGSSVDSGKSGTNLAKKVLSS
jgi:methane monooxygenase component A beta chain